jgi:hypothetical protein
MVFAIVLRMELNRREVIAGTLGLAATLARPTPVRAQPLANPGLFETAKREYERLGSKIWLRDKAGIADFSLPSSQPRFFLIDMMSGKVKPYLVTHGRGSDPEHDGWLKLFSNLDGSGATSRGAYLTHTWYDGKHGASMRLSGLDPDNFNAADRAIVIHTAPYADPEHVAEFGKLGRSDGCFVFPEAQLMEILAYLGPGRMIFADRISPQVVPPKPDDPLFPPAGIVP